MISKDKNIFWVLVILTLLSSFRTFIIPLHGDELTYLNISENLFKGKYYQLNNPSTVSPIIPFIINFFKIPDYPLISIHIAKLFQIIITILGFRYVFLFLNNMNIDQRIKISILALAIVNPIGIVYYSNLYPESIILFSFWGILFYCSSNNYSKINLIKILSLFVLLSLTRYLYLLMAIPISIYIYKYLNINKLKLYSISFLKYLLIVIIPFVLWFKYVYTIESSNISEISYFDRFKEENFLLYNIKAGLGLIQHHEVNKINGVPAFISLFVPITGLRNFFMSVVLILLFVLGFVLNRKNKSNIIFYTTILIMLGLLFAGTGFSRYWVTMLPVYLTGFYLAYNRLKLNDKFYVIISYLICFIYVMNEFRLDYMILTKFITND